MSSGVHEIGKVYMREGSEKYPSPYYIQGHAQQDGVDGLVVRRPWWPRSKTFWCPVDEVTFIEMENAPEWRAESEERTAREEAACRVGIIVIE
jgi:hypothetical protein